MRNHWSYGMAIGRSHNISFSYAPFFLLSGYFLSKQYQFIKFVKLKFRQLLMPYLCTCIAGCFLAIIANVFLLALFLALILIYLLGDITKGYIFVIMIAGMSFVSSKYIWLPWSVQAGGTAAVFVYVGYLAKKNNILRSWNRKLTWIGLLVWAIEVILDIQC